MQVPYFRAKDKDSDTIVEGFYANFPVVKNPSESDILANISHGLLTYRNGIMGLINEPVFCTIDMTTLEFIKFVDVPCQTEKIIL